MIKSEDTVQLYIKVVQNKMHKCVQLSNGPRETQIKMNMPFEIILRDEIQKHMIKGHETKESNFIFLATLQ